MHNATRHRPGGVVRCGRSLWLLVVLDWLRSVGARLARKPAPPGPKAYLAVYSPRDTRLNVLGYLISVWFTIVRKFGLVVT